MQASMKVVHQNVLVFYFPPPIYSSPPDFNFQSITQPPSQLFPPLPPWLFGTQEYVIVITDVWKVSYCWKMKIKSDA